MYIHTATTKLICGHKFCSKCLSSFLIACIENDSAFRCPGYKCGAIINPDGLLPRKIMEAKARAEANKRSLIEQLKYEKERARRLYNKDGHERLKIECPDEKCKGAVNKQADATIEHADILICSKCNRAICDYCRDFKHEGDCGKEYLEAVAFINKMTKPCPACGVNIEKNAGCNHMRCTICKTHFKWNETEKGQPIRRAVLTKAIRW